ncbi:MAG: TolC family protein [Bacteroidota bacterium]
MKRNLRLWLLLLMGLLGHTTGLFGQTINELLEEAFQHNVALKALAEEYLADLEIGAQHSQLPNPVLGLAMFPLPVETRLGPQQLRLSASQEFPWFGLLAQKKDLEMTKANAKLEQIAARQLTIRYEMEQAYLQLYEIQANQKIIRRSIPLWTTLERLALAKIESGKGNVADVILVQLKRKELEQELLIMDQQKTEAITTINQLTQQPLERNITIEDSLTFAELPFVRDTLFAAIEDHHPMIKLFELQQSISNKSIALNELSVKPSFSLGLDYIFVGDRADATPMGNGRDILQFRATVKVPIYRQKFRAKNREEQHRIKALAWHKEEVRTKFFAEIEAALSDYKTTVLQKQLYQEQIILTQSAIQTLQAKYSAQSEGFEELLYLQDQLIGYDLKILQAIVESHRSLSRIRRFVF